MSPRSVMRFVEWTIGAPRGELPQTTIVIRCLEPACTATSGPSPSRTGPGVTITVHRELCTSPPRPRTYTYPSH
ncbi:hypothetical protein G3I76_33795 [Streptomyces sp. SID11233]|nr:hypothetical protein [Streptomyces sp. SID11233]